MEISRLDPAEAEVRFDDEEGETELAPVIVAPAHHCAGVGRQSVVLVRGCA